MKLFNLLKFNNISSTQIKSKAIYVSMENLRQFQNFAWCKPDWCYPSMSKETNELLRQCTDLPEVQVTDDLDQIIKKSQEFPVPFPIETVRLHKLRESVPEETLRRNVKSTYPLIHERVLLIITHFLIYKRELGTSIEKSLYKDMTITEFIDRLLQKRAITFMGPNDRYKLITGEDDKDGWELVGTLQQKPPLTLDKVLSYDEMKISSMVYISSMTKFINDGSRTNAGVVGPAEEEGVIIGLIGPRLQRKFRMEFEDILITDQQNCFENGYGEEVTPTTCLNMLKTTYVWNNQSTKHMWRQIWSEFYQVHSYTYEELTSYVNLQEKLDEKSKYTERYVKLPLSETVFDNEVYYKRLCVPFECSLLEADARAKNFGKMAFLNVIGIGLGVWKISTHQTDVYVLTFLERLRSLLRKYLLNNVSDVVLAYIKPSPSIRALFTKEGSQENKIFFESKRHPNGGISVQLQNREPSAKLPEIHKDKLLVITYPWDGNAHPGNEFWLNSLTGSGDPAAACSTQITELHNAHINPAVDGRRTFVATAKGLKSLKVVCEERSK